MTIWLEYADQTTAQAASVSVYNFCKVSPGYDENLVGSPTEVSGSWWVEVPANTPLEKMTHISVSEDAPEDIPVLQTEEMLLSIFDGLMDIMQDFMVENTLSGITSSDTKALADGLKDLWYYCQTAPTAAIGEIDRLMALPIGSRISGLTDTSLVDDNRLTEFKNNMLSVIFG